MIKGNKQQTSNGITQDIFMTLNSVNLKGNNFNNSHNQNNSYSINGIKYAIDHDNYVTVCGAEDYLQFASIPSSICINNNLYYVTSIRDFAFANCKNLKQVILNNDIFYIGLKAFYNCSNLRIIQIPKTVAAIGNDAFNGCDMDKLKFILEDSCVSDLLLTAQISTKNINVNKHHNKESLLFM